MSSIKLSIFSQMPSPVDRNIVQKVVREYGTDKHHKGINTRTHFGAMLFMQIADAGSLWDISNGLRRATGNLCHLGIAMAPFKSCHSNQNKLRKYEVFRDLYFALLERLKPSLQRRRLFLL